MGLFSRIKSAFVGGGEKTPLWQVPTSDGDIDRIFDASLERPQLIYKHSSACTLSWASRSNLEAESRAIRDEADAHYIDVLRDRALSDRVAEMAEVPHQSPQGLLVYGGEVVWEASHLSVRAEAVLDALRRIGPAPRVGDDHSSSA
ncbi:MAG: bacillithiol system redox-active protein YtxJ [Gemmatimonadota bacterium]|nr:bacillithiol system redox-active protein YtxJ [Gemmatimonadota bacterium]